MPVTPAQFRSAFPEFKNLGDAVVQARLDEAYVSIGAWEESLRELGVQWLAADLITTSPMAEPSAKGKNASGKSPYRVRFDELAAQARIFGTAVPVMPLAPEPGG